MEELLKVRIEEFKLQFSLPIVGEICRPLTMQFMIKREELFRLFITSKKI